MKLVKSFVILLSSLVLAACGGGGGSAGSSGFGGGSGSGSGGGSGSGSGSGSISLSLQDSSGNTISPPALTGTQNAVAVIHLLDKTGAAVANTLVTVSGTGLSLTPATGQTLTDSTGTARVQVQAADPFASGATTIKASGSASGAVVETTLDVALGAATAQLGALTLSANTVPAYQTIQVSVGATLSGGSQPAVQVPVSFSASCGTFDPQTANTDTSGVARSAYRNQTATGVACSGQQTLTATAGASTTNATVTTVAPAAANMVFVSASAGEIQAAKTYRKNTQAKNAMEKGFTTQFTNRVISRPTGRLPTSRTEANSTFIIIGTIISQISTAIGRLMWLPCPTSAPRRLDTTPGTACPISTPATMQSATQSVRYRSKNDSRFVATCGS